MTGKTTHITASTIALQHMTRISIGDLLTAVELISLIRVRARIGSPTTSAGKVVNGLAITDLEKVELRQPAQH